MICKTCGNNCIKNGFQANGKQRYYCKHCKLHQQRTYTYKAYGKGINNYIYKLLINSSRISDIARVLRISKNTVISRILKIAGHIKKPYINESHQIYEMDELYTKVSGESCWISYAINRKTKQVIDFIVGSRCNRNLTVVVGSLLHLNPKRVFTDKLINYHSLIPKQVHNNARFQTNLIERFNLNLRTHLKRLSRKTLCYSKTRTMLEATLRIYFWGCPENIQIKQEYKIAIN